MTSRAWQATAYGEPGEVLTLVEPEVPDPGPGEVRVRNAAVVLNFPDVLLCRGQYQVRPEHPFVPGIECCGVVEAVGEGVDSVSVGDRVVASLIGVMAEEAIVPAASVFPGVSPVTVRPRPSPR